MYIKGHGISDERIAALRYQAQRFFELSSRQKMKVYIGLSGNHQGYVPPGEEVLASGGLDQKESYDLGYDLTVDPDGHNPWPELPGFREEVQAYYHQILKLGDKLMRAFSLALGEPEQAFDHCIRSPPSQLRLLHYPRVLSVTDEPGLGAHTDYECFTLLHTTSPGLEIMNSDGDWIDVPPIPGTLVLNIGDILEILSNGTFIATSHRVRRVIEERYSFPLFYSFDYPTWVEPLPQFMKGGAQRYRGVIVGDHLLSQNIQIFKYLQEKQARGEVQLPAGALALSSFGHEARQRLDREFEGK